MRLLIFILLLPGIRSFGQSDTTYTYLDSSWKIVSKDSAQFVNKVFKDGSQWHQQQFWLNNGSIKLDGHYDDAKTETSNGIQKYYDENGIEEDSSFWEHGKEIYEYVFYENHSLKGYATFDIQGNISKQAGWTKEGKEIPNYIFEKEAYFAGGWGRYIGTSLTKTFSDEQLNSYQDGKIYGTVVIAFTVYPDGSVHDVSIYQSSGYKVLDMDAMNIIIKSPKWIPAIQYNEPVRSKKLQPITYSKATGE